MLDPFKILGIKEDATELEIKQAYYKLAKKFHPDHCPDYERNLYVENFLNVTWAYNVLRDEERKKEIKKQIKEGKIEREIDKIRREAREKLLKEGMNLLRKNNVRAEKYLKMAWFLDKYNPISQSYYGLVLVYLGKKEEGFELLNKAYQTEPNNIDIILNLVEAYLQTENLRNAKGFIKKGMKIGKNDRRLLYLIEKIKRR